MNGDKTVMKEASPLSNAKFRTKSAHNKGLFGKETMSVYDKTSIMGGDAGSVMSKMSTVSGHHRILSGHTKGDAMRMCMRIWSGFSKLLRSQCNKNRVIDTLFFGSFYRNNNEFVYVSEGKG